MRVTITILFSVALSPFTVLAATTGVFSYGMLSSYLSALPTRFSTFSAVPFFPRPSISVVATH
jgi:hypothetical protein